MIPTRSVANVLKKLKKHIDTKKGKFPETESLTHQKPPYVGDVGLERPGRRRPGRGMGRRRIWEKPDPREKYGRQSGKKTKVVAPATGSGGATRPVSLRNGGSTAQQHYMQHGYGPHKIKMAKAFDKAVKGNKLTKKSFA